MSAYAGLRNIILIGTLFGFHGLLNRSLLIDGVNEIFIVTSRISVVTLLIGIYCFREFISSISVEYFLKGSLSGILAIFIPGWAFIYALKYISSGLQSIFISTIPLFTVFWVLLLYKDEKITNYKSKYKDIQSELFTLSLQSSIKKIDNVINNKSKKIIINSNTSKNKFLSIVNKAKKYIKLGDIFQVVLSQRFETKLTKKPIDIYKKLRITNPSPFMFFFNFTDFQIIGASPEILVRLRDGEITVRPIAGTRPRGKTVKEDRFYEKDLLKDKKELSEHLMLLDLGRNDAGKVSKTNSIKVTESFIIERYSHVMHIVSNVIGKHDKRFSKFKSLLAGFPAGTVSGAPKIRAMEIIDELESTKRKVYAGGIGYFAANGEFDTCIALRTAVAKNDKFYVQAGAGIVADSKPLKEYEETVNKAKALINALK